MSHRGRRNQPLARPDSSRQESVSSHLSQPSAPTRSDDTITETGHGETEAGALARVFDGDRGYDVGAAVMFTNGSGQKPADVTGTQGIRINGPGTPSVWHFGFPLNAPSTARI